MREPAVDGRVDKIGGEVSKRDCHVDLSRAAVFALGDAVSSCCWICDEFIKPATATGNRCKPLLFNGLGGRSRRGRRLPTDGARKGMTLHGLSSLSRDVC
jgi:hypothetical protein